MPDRRNPFKGREELIDEPFGVAAQVAQDARLGDQDGIDGQAQLGGDRLGRCPIDDLPPERLPGGRPELGLDQRPAGDAGRTRRAPGPSGGSGRWPGPPVDRAPSRDPAGGSSEARTRRDRQDWRRQLIGDRPQPGPERPGAPIVPEPRDLADDDPENLLREVLRVLSETPWRRSQALISGDIEVNQPSPRDGIRPIVQPFQQRGGRLGPWGLPRTLRILALASCSERRP